MRYKTTKSVVFHTKNYARLIAWLEQTGKFNKGTWSDFVRSCLEDRMFAELAGKKSSGAIAPSFDVALMQQAAQNGIGAASHPANGAAAISPDVIAQAVGQALDARQLNLAIIRQTIDAALKASGGIAKEANGATPPATVNVFDMLDDDMVV